MTPSGGNDTERVRALLKNAVERQPVPPGLQSRVRDRLSRGTQKRRWFAWWQLSVVATAAAAMAMAVFVVRPYPALPDIANRSAQDSFILRVSNTVASVFRPGLQDHVHCTLFRRYAQNPPSPEKLAADLGPAWAGLLPAMKESIPDGYQVVMAHQCGYQGRRYVHVAMRNDSSLLSLVIARKQAGESLDQLAPAQIASGIPLYGVKAERFQIAAFDAGAYVVYVVSALDRERNLIIAASMAPAVRPLLLNKPASVG